VTSGEDDALGAKDPVLKSSQVWRIITGLELRMFFHEYAILVDIIDKNINRPGNMEFNLVEQIL
jgi:hypothetical protein